MGWFEEYHPRWIGNRVDPRVRGRKKRSRGGLQTLHAPLTISPKIRWAPTSVPASGTGSATTSTASQTSASIVAQEPAMLTAIIIAGLQVLVIAEFTGAADEATQSTIVGGLTALGGILICGRVSPTQTQVTPK